jgi:hypothetical protein
MASGRWQVQDASKTGHAGRSATQNYVPRPFGKAFLWHLGVTFNKFDASCTPMLGCMMRRKRGIQGFQASDVTC